MLGTSPEKEHTRYHGTACQVHVWFHPVHMLGAGTACWVQVQKKNMPGTMALHATYMFGFLQCTCWVQALHAGYKSRKRTCQVPWHCMPSTCLVSSSAHAGCRHCMLGTSPEKEHARYHGTACHVHVWFYPVHMLGAGTACWVQVQEKNMLGTMALHATYMFGFIQCTCWVQALHAAYKSRKRTCQVPWLCMPRTCSVWWQCTCWVQVDLYLACTLKSNPYLACAFC